ncbi:hypothetical protein BOQ00_03435 [Campylobacter coli]|nr:hypothetical protein BOQ00_03435 [Campylobacter coli]
MIKKFLAKRKTKKRFERNYKIIKESGLFDVDYYFENYPDVKAAGIDPIKHYLMYGWREGRNPNDRFDTFYYLKRYDDVSQKLINPLIHYIMHGKKENRETLLKQQNAKFDTKRKNFSWHRDVRITLNSYLTLHPMHKFFNINSLLIHWVIPDFSIGGGGHMTIFRMIYFLEKLGHRQVIWIQNVSMHDTPKEAKETIIKHYQPIGDNVDVCFLPEDVEWISGDIVVATEYLTVFPVCAMSKFKKRFYFIQDYEPMFHQMGEMYLIAEQTYKMGLTPITAGKWLERKISQYSDTVYSFPLCVDHNIYKIFKKTKKTKKTKKINIAVYSRSHTPRRCVGLIIAGLKQLYKEFNDFHVSFFGQNDIPYEIDFEYTNYGILNPQELSVLYNSCDIGIVFSATNYSLIPLEMMACGLPVIEIDTESTRAVFNEDIISFVQADPRSISKGILSLINHKEKRQQQAECALKFVENLKWENSALKLNDAFYTELKKDDFISVKIDDLENSGFSSEIYATVVIPTLNAVRDIERLLLAILKQKTSFKFDILIIDSSSDDGTIEVLKDYSNKYSNIHYKVIQRSEFQHGKTRDFAIEQSRGDYVAFLTQDALPYNQFWLEELIKCFAVDKKIAGVFGRHIAYDTHSPFVKRDIKNHFEHYGKLPRLYSWDDSLQYPFDRNSKEWQMKMMFYSDNNSAISKKIWKYINYPHVDWGEDQVWAWTIIQLGLKKYYAKKSIVYHSHSYSYEQRKNISEIESNYFYNSFGIDTRIDNETSANNLVNSLNQNDIIYAKEKHIDVNILREQLQLNCAYIFGKFKI